MPWLWDLQNLPETGEVQEPQAPVCRFSAYTSAPWGPCTPIK